MTANPRTLLACRKSDRSPSKFQEAGLADIAPSRVDQYNGELDSHAKLIANDIEQAFNPMASYITRKGRELANVVIGGAASTRLLPTHDTTRDVNFFGGQLHREDAKLLMEASEHVRQKLAHLQLDSVWFNNRMSFFIDTEIRAQLEAESLNQNVILFEARGFILRAIAWAYQFCAKVRFMVDQVGRSYDAGTEMPLIICASF